MSRVPDETVPYRALRETPREALTALVEPAVASGCTFVLFSGGRDSSAMLAVAVSIARRIGVPDPVPVIGRHEGVPEADEASWQDLVLTHLDIRERVIRAFRGEQSLLSDDATSSLREAGLVWPPALHVQNTYLRDLPEAAVITGEGGDASISGRRVTALADAVRGARPRAAAHELRRLAVRRRRQIPDAAVSSMMPWLTASGVALARQVLGSSAEPVVWSKGIRASISIRPARMVRLNFVEMLRRHGYTAVNPLEHPRFIAALAREGGVTGYGDRTTMMRRLFGDLLPDAVLARTTKASFNNARWTERERAFARSWTGEGVDHEFIDAERLRAAWLEENPPIVSDLHLHAAWLAEHGLAWDPDGN